MILNFYGALMVWDGFGMSFGDKAWNLGQSEKKKTWKKVDFEEKKMLFGDFNTLQTNNVGERTFSESFV